MLLDVKYKPSFSENSLLLNISTKIWLGYQLRDSTIPASLSTTILLIGLLDREQRIFSVFPPAGIVTLISFIVWHYLPVLCTHK